MNEVDKIIAELEWFRSVLIKGGKIPEYYEAQSSILTKAIKLLEQLDRKTGEWILCSERMPDDNDYKPFSYYEDGAVLYCIENGKVGFGWYYESTKQWANEDDCYPGDVIAWMPIPEPIKEKMNERTLHD